MTSIAYDYYLLAKEEKHGFTINAVKIAFELTDDQMNELELLYRKEHEVPNLLKEQVS